MEEKNTNQQDFEKYTKASLEAEQTGDYQPLINWYNQQTQIFEGGSYAAQKCCFILQKYLKTDHHLIILDIGCGTGDQACILKKMGIEADFYGIDMSTAMLEVAEKKQLYKELRNLILPIIPYSDESFDIVISAGTLCSPGNAPPATLPEMIRVTKPGGLLCFSYRQHWFDNIDSGWQEIHSDLIRKGLIQELFFEVDDYIPSQKIKGLYFIFKKSIDV